MDCKFFIAQALEDLLHFELPAGGPEGLNTHAHSEQPQPESAALQSIPACGA
jgi:hypothetical protein